MLLRQLLNDVALMPRVCVEKTLRMMTRGKAYSAAQASTMLQISYKQLPKSVGRRAPRPVPLTLR